MAGAGRLDVSLGLDAAQYTTGLTKAADQAKKFQTQLATTAAAVTTSLKSILTGYVAIQAVKGFTGLVGQLDDLDEAAQNVGASSAVALANFQRAALDAGVGTEQLSKALTKLNVGLTDAAGGDKKAAAAFQTLGISVKDASGQIRSSDEVLKDVADRFSQYADGAKKSALAAALFGEKVGPQMVALLNQGRAGLEGYNQVTQETIDRAKELQSQFDKLGANTQKVAYQLVGLLAPALNEVLDRFNRAITATGDWDVALNRLFLNRSVDRLRQDIANAEEKLSDLDNATFFKESRQEAQRKLIEKLRKELEFLGNEAERVSRIRLDTFLTGKSALNQFGDVGRGRAGLPEAPTVPTIKTGGGKSAAEKAAEEHERFLDRQRDALARYVEELAKAAEGEQHLTKEQQLSIDINQGRFAAILIPELEAFLRTLAKAADAQDEYNEKVKHNAKVEREALDALQARSDRLNDLTGRTNLKNLNADIALLQEHLNDGPLTPERLEEYRKGWDRLFPTDNIEKATDAFEELGLTFSSALEDAIVDFNSIRDIVKGLEQDLLRIGTRKLVTEPLANWATEFLKGMGGSGGGGGFGSILGALFGSGGGGSHASAAYFADLFAAGGSDFVPRDMLAYVHRGERIVPADQNRKGSMGNINMTFVLPAGGVSRETQNQIAQRAGQAIRQAQRIS